MDRLPPVEHGDPCEETTLASVGKPLLDHLDGSNAIKALPVGNRLLHQLERIISHAVIVDQVVATVNGSLSVRRTGGLHQSGGRGRGDP